MDGITKGGHLLEEPALTSCSLLARTQLLKNASLRQETAPGDTLSERCWTMTSGAVCDIISSRRFEKPGDKPFETLSKYFRACAYYATLLHTMKLEPYTIRRNAIQAVAERVSSTATIDLSQLSPIIRFWVADFQKTSYRTYGPGGDGGGRLFTIPG